ncbi:MAG: hypothetical protein AVDCRST_MAG68-5413, partial [uncultured Gemmatimonadetes bacterium]
VPRPVPGEEPPRSRRGGSFCTHHTERDERTSQPTDGRAGARAAPHPGKRPRRGDRHGGGRHSLRARGGPPRHGAGPHALPPRRQGDPLCPRRAAALRGRRGL